MKDMFAKGRRTAAIGERASKAKMTDRKVRKARRDHKNGVPCSALAKRYGIAKSTMRGIINRQTWRHIK
jgi:transposase